MEDTTRRIAKFHAHLDVCSQCETHPFELCSTGGRLLKEAATGLVDDPRKEVINGNSRDNESYLR